MTAFWDGQLDRIGCRLATVPHADVQRAGSRRFNRRIPLRPDQRKWGRLTIQLYVQRRLARPGRDSKLATNDLQNGSGPRRQHHHDNDHTEEASS
jgi:hypothetical protein